MSVDDGGGGGCELSIWIMVVDLFFYILRN